MENLVHIIEALTSVGWLVWAYILVGALAQGAAALDKHLQDERRRKDKMDRWVRSPGE